MNTTFDNKNTKSCTVKLTPRAFDLLTKKVKARRSAGFSCNKTAYLSELILNAKD